MPYDRPKFRWKCSYQGNLWYEVWDETGTYEVELRRRADDYERKYYNGDDADWKRNVVDMIGVLRRAYSIDKPIPDSTFHAFNAWVLAEHAGHIKQMESQPERYGAPGTYKIQKPHTAHAAARYDGRWIITITKQPVGE